MSMGREAGSSTAAAKTAASGRNDNLRSGTDLFWGLGR